MLEVADRVGFPVMLTTYHIPFVVLAKAVAEASQRVQEQRLERALQVYELSRAASVAGHDLAELLVDLGDQVAATLYVVDPRTGRSVLATAPVPEELGRQVAAHHGALREGQPLRLRTDLDGTVDSSAGTVSALLLPGLRPSVLVAVPRAESEPDQLVLRHVVGVVALERTRQAAESERARRLGASLLAQLVDRRLEPAAARAQLRERGLGDRPMVLVACPSAEGTEEWQQVHHALDDAGTEHLLLTRGNRTYALLADDESALRGLREALPERDSMGVSDPFLDPAQATSAQQQARWALHLASDRGLPLLRHSAELPGSLFLPGRHEDSHAVARRVLGPLLDYDAAHAEVLVPSLRVFLEENRSWQRAAERLHVHKQTLVYRMQRVEDLTGRRLDVTSDVAEVWLALQAAAAAALLDA